MPERYPLITLIICFILVISCSPTEEKEKDLVIGGISFDIPKGFELEDLYTVSKSGDGSWVSIAEGPDNQYFACDQYGGIHTFQMPGIGEILDSTAVKELDLNIGFAHGLLWAFNSLYVVVVNDVDEDNPDDPTTGVYRLRDTNGDGELDKQRKLLDLNGEGEHGPHTLRISPDGASLYFIAGNFNDVPDHFKSRLPRNWGEDNLFPPYLDARGHAVDLKAPGGWLAKTDPEGKEWELIGAGMRNPFSFGINRDGELLAYDADMEWDFGMPWYRPTRILHVTSGAEFGWRTGSGKWSVHYPDNLPAVTNMAQGSPTAVIMGKDLAFPAKYKNGLFACDWSFGTIYFVDIDESGSSYIGTKEEFLSGVPLPISNATAGSDGHLYFTTGGRRLESHLYRLRYTGDQPTDDSVIAPSDPGEQKLRELRHSLERFHKRSTEDVVSVVWPHLDHEDAHIRHAARIALEHQPLASWAEHLWKEEEPEKIIYGGLAYARSDGALKKTIISKLETVDWDELRIEDQVALLRTYSLLLIRNRKASNNFKEDISNRLAPLFPADDPRLNRELSQLLLYLEHPDAIEKTMAILEDENKQATDANSDILTAAQLERSEMYGPQILDMIANMPPTEAIHYVTNLSHAKTGWTPELRKQYFEWFYTALSKKGGMSYKAFLDNIRAKALSNVPEAEQEYFQNISGFYSPTRDMANLPQPIGPGKAYNLYDMGRIVLWDNDIIENYKGTIAEGQRAYDAALCSACHRIRGEGGSSGPDLTNINTRFNKNEISASLLSPNEEISDQYAFTVFTMNDGSKKTGRIVGETDEHYTIYQSPYDMTNTTEVLKTDVMSKSLSPLSPMPAKLLDRLNEEEVLDLFVYLLSGGDSGSGFYD